MKDKVGFFHENKRQSCVQKDTIIFSDWGQGFPEVQKIVSSFLYNFSRKK